MAATAERSVVVFDLGGVLIEWNPRYLYRRLFAGDEAGMEAFLAEVCTEEWNERQDLRGGGRAYRAPSRQRRSHPRLVRSLRRHDAWRHQGSRLHPVRAQAEQCLTFHRLLDRYSVEARSADFIDDNPANAKAATSLGIHGIHFSEPARLRGELASLGLL